MSIKQEGKEKNSIKLPNFISAMYLIFEILRWHILREYVTFYQAPVVFNTTMTVESLE